MIAVFDGLCCDKLKFMKISPIKFLLAFTLICAFSVLSSAQDLQIDISDRKLNILELPDPKFKEFRHIQGATTIRITFQADGKIGQISPISSFNSEVAEEVIEAARRIKFEPEIRDGKPISVTTTLQYIFSWEKWGWRNTFNKTLEENKITQIGKSYISDRKLKILEMPSPKLTEEQRKENICVQGQVVLRVEFLSNSEIGNITVVRPLSHGLAENAIEAAKKIKFEPEIKDGMATTVIMSVQYTFKWGWINTSRKKEESSENTEKDKSQQP